MSRTTPTTGTTPPRWPPPTRTTARSPTTPLGQTLRGRDQIRAYVQQQFDGFPDDRSEVVDVISAGDWTVGRFVTVGTHTGDWAGIEPTHREARTSVCSIVRWRDGLAVEDHIYYDLYGSLAQLGQVPPLTADA